MSGVTIPRWLADDFAAREAALVERERQAAAAPQAAPYSLACEAVEACLALYLAPPDHDGGVIEAVIDLGRRAAKLRGLPRPAWEAAPTAAPLGAGPALRAAGRYRCTVCHEPGHNSRTCPRRGQR